ncbi:Hsp70 family protein [Scytonema sp. NUACC26]|uniref:Hsp70 family protein n=1 Tax=Scytonema sp. NUACC26 TaxID=3140176 RepID=UPI0034DC2B23
MSKDKINDVETILEQLNDNQFEIIGFDLGHGKTAIAKINYSKTDSNNTEPTKLKINNKDHIMTAIAYDSIGNAVLGEQAFDLALEDLAREFEICFKQRPSQEGFPQKLIENFVNAVYKNLQNTSQLISDRKKLFFVGCPSGWFDDEAKRYKEMLENCLANVVVIKESRAAFIHALEIKTIPLTINDIKRGILVIDIGSSTTDFTFIQGKTVKDFGHSKYNLGASLIEREILKQSLKLQEKKEEIQKIIENNEQLRKCCEVLCRESKEKYFSYSSPEIYKERYISSRSEELQPGLEFKPKVNGRIMDEILNTHLKEFENKTWKQTFYEQLKEIKKELTEGINIRKILLTGGGAKMHFVNEICAQVFPDSSQILDSEHEVCVALGLARWGRYCINQIEYNKKINSFLDRELENLIKRIINHSLFPNLEKKLVEALIKEQLIKDCLNDWRSNKVSTLESLEYYIPDKVGHWLRGDKAKEISKNEMKNLLTDIKLSVQDEINKLSRNHFREETILNMLDDSVPGLNSAVQNILRQINNHEFNFIDTVKLASQVPGIVSGVMAGTVSAAITWFMVLDPTNVAFFAVGVGLAVKTLVDEHNISNFKEIGEEKIKKMNIPVIVRKRILTDRKIEEIINNINEQIKNSQRDPSEKQLELTNEITQFLQKNIAQEFKTQEDKDISLLI